MACGHCGEVADAAVLCPSFYKAHKVNNPTGWDKWLAGLRTSAVGWLQGRRERERTAKQLYAATIDEVRA